ncbi:MAG TPA: helix-turn-helix transcriptional regulator [Chitinophagales bacterium]|nr:helix-turn-helix transcriptional regulator [Chitinophagales bacterium]
MKYYFLCKMVGENVLLIKNMVCQRCVMAVQDILKAQQITPTSVLVGEVHLSQPISDTQRNNLGKSFSAIGLELIDNRNTGLIEKIKQLVIAKARNEAEDKENKNLSVYLSAKLHHEYTYLSSLFSSVEGKTIEAFFIEQRIEKAKELLVYGQMSQSEIAYELGFSSVAHLSGQFKKVTGLTPSHFKAVGSSKRKSLDSI